MNAKKADTLSGKKILVVGLGMTGLSTAKFLKKSGAIVTATDCKDESAITGVKELKQAGITVEAGGHRVESFTFSDMIVVSPGVDSRMPFLKEAERRAVEIISDVELFYRLADCPVFAVTGTNGKSTTTALLCEVFKNAGKKVFMGGNIGTPVMEYFNGAACDMAVLEISSFHLEAVKTFKPRAAILLNVTEDHLYRHSSFDEYVRTKMRIFENQTQEDYAIVNVGDPAVKNAVAEASLKSRVIPFTAYGALDRGLFFDGKEIIRVLNGEKESYPVAGINLRGIHNIENIMAVIAAARAGGVSSEDMLDTIRGFKGLPHRMELVRELNGVRYVNDSKSTNVGSLYKALEGIAINSHPSVILIAGGVDKGGDYGALKEVVEGRVKFLILVGEAGDKIKNALKGVSKATSAATFKEAVRIASENAAVGDTVLLSPACSSFDMFKNFEERGEVFRTLVEAL